MRRRNLSEEAAQKRVAERAQRGESSGEELAEAVALLGAGQLPAAVPSPHAVAIPSFPMSGNAYRGADMTATDAPSDEHHRMDSADNRRERRPWRRWCGERRI